MSRVAVDFSSLEDALEFVNTDSTYDHQACLSLESGEIFWYSDSGDFEDELPEDIDEPDRYLTIPHRNDLNLGERLALHFAAEHLPDQYAKVQDIFNRSGAYRRFKDLLENQNALQQWYDYEQQETHAALRRWCEENEVDVQG